MTFIDKIIKVDTNIKHKIITRKYREVINIFGKNNNAPELLESISSYNYYQYTDFSFALTCGSAEELYDKYVDNIAEFIYDLKKNPSVDEIMYIYCYLLFNGYLSLNNKFRFIFPELELSTRMGLSAIWGQGVCRNVSDLLCKILDVYCIENYRVVTDRGTYNSEDFDVIKEYINTMFNSEDDKLFNQQLNNYIEEHDIETMNHCEILTKDDKWRLLDPSNAITYKIIKHNNGYNVSHYIKYHSLYTYGVCNMKRTIELYNYFKDKYLLADNSKENKLIQKECFNICEKNKQKIKKFHMDNYDYIKQLSGAIPKENSN